MLNSISSVNPSGFSCMSALFRDGCCEKPIVDRKRAGTYSSRPLSRFLGQPQIPSFLMPRNYQVRRLLLGMGFPAGLRAGGAF